MTSDSRPAGDLTAAQVRANSWLAWIGAAVALTGAQLIAPSLPVMGEALNLSEPQLSLVMSVYLLPAALATIPLGMLADRLGRRIVYGGSLLLFGICGLVLAAVGSFGLFLGVRLVQGIAFAGLLPITMTILGDTFAGVELIGAQGRRSVAMSLGDGLLPVLGGLLVVGGWHVPWLGQGIAVPLGIIVLLKLVDVQSLHSSEKGRPRFSDFMALFRSKAILALQYAGFLRMFLKFAILTFLPVYLVDVRQESAAFAGLVVGVAALAGTVIAALSGRIARRGKPTVLILAGVTAMGLALGGMIGLPSSGLILASAVVYGAGDGLMGVFINSFTTAATGPEQRAGFVAATGAVRNLAKFTAPAAFGALTLALPVAPAFYLLSGLAIASVLLIGLVKPLEARLGDYSLRGAG